MSNSQLPRVTIYTDGACSGNPGPGGWAAILLYGAHKKELSGGESNTTNNRMELMAVIRALEELRMPCRATVYTDSRYVVDAMKKGWAVRWRQNSWMRTKTDRAKNPDLWQRLLELCETHSIDFMWVRGHEENELNNRCDKLAVAQSKKLLDNPIR